MEAEGVFITNSIMGIMKVSKIEDKVINESTVVSEIKRYYDRYVENYKGRRKLNRYYSKGVEIINKI